jgi:hypothetical protein
MGGLMSFTIETPSEFFEHIVTVDVLEFLNNQPNHRAAYHACTSLLSYRDWILTAYKGKVWVSAGTSNSALNTVKKFQGALERYQHSFAIVTDVANASKHMLLETGRARTKIRGNSSTVVMDGSGAFNTGVFNSVGFNEALRHIKVKDGGEMRDVSSCVRDVYEAWRALNVENGWQ